MNNSILNKRTADELARGKVVATAITVAIYHATRELFVGIYFIESSPSDSDVLNAVKSINYAARMT